MIYDYDPDVGHAIPKDDFIHVESMNCPCGPTVECIPGFISAVCHRRMDAPPVPDTIPEDFK